MEAKKTNNNSYHQTTAIIGMGIVAISTQFSGNVRLYIMFPTITIMLISVLFKMRREITDGVFDKHKYISGALALLFSIAVFVFFYFFIH